MLRSLLSIINISILQISWNSVMLIWAKCLELFWVKDWCSTVTARACCQSVTWYKMKTTLQKCNGMLEARARTLGLRLIPPNEQEGGTLCHWPSWARLALFVAPTLHADRETSSRARPLESLMYQKQTKGSVFDGFILMAWNNEKQSCTRIMPTSFLTKVNKLRMRGGSYDCSGAHCGSQICGVFLNPTGRSKSKKGFHWVRCWTSNQLVPMTLWAWYNWCNNRYHWCKNRYYWCNNRYHWCYKGINID